ncbi:MAG: phosphatase PAP2 family protein [Candidatus Pacearchaeota archaeon]
MKFLKFLKERDLVILISTLILAIISFLFLDNLKFTKIKFLDILLIPFKEQYSYITLIILILACFSYLNRKKRSKLKKETISLLLTIIIVFLIKFLISRERPIEGFYIGKSFPSAHSAIMFSLLPFLSNNFYYIWLIISLIIGISRIYFGYHYFSDFFVGCFIGYGIALIIKNLKIKRKK